MLNTFSLKYGNFDNHFQLTPTLLSLGFRKISLDDLRKAYIVKDVQQYILHRLDQEEALR